MELARGKYLAVTLRQTDRQMLLLRKYGSDIRANDMCLLMNYEIWVIFSSAGQPGHPTPLLNCALEVILGIMCAEMRQPRKKESLLTK